MVAAAPSSRRLWLQLLGPGAAVTFIDETGARYDRTVSTRGLAIYVLDSDGETRMTFDGVTGEGPHGRIEEPRPDHPVSVARRADRAKREALAAKKRAGRAAVKAEAKRALNARVDAICAGGRL